MKNPDSYAHLQPIPGEEIIVDFDENFEMWAVVGTNSGFYHALFIDKSEAETRLQEIVPLPV